MKKITYETQTLLRSMAKRNEKNALSSLLYALKSMNDASFNDMVKGIEDSGYSHDETAKQLRELRDCAKAKEEISNLETA